jgi:hypothetical protein
MAQGARPAEVFAAVAKEVALLLGAPTTAIDRYESDGSSTVVGAWGDGPWQTGVRSPNDGGGDDDEELAIHDIHYTPTDR